jgi:hypothetical protein
LGFPKRARGNHSFIKRLIKGHFKKGGDALPKIRWVVNAPLMALGVVIKTKLILAFYM